MLISFKYLQQYFDSQWIFQFLLEYAQQQKYQNRLLIFVNVKLIQLVPS